MFQTLKCGLFLLILAAGIAGCAATRETSSGGVQNVELGGETRVRASYQQ